ncbi:MAG: glycosyltransferase [Proteobacteria bacterium]|nr:glycosyltransferase [Pseudomonadota bacterium]
MTGKRRILFFAEAVTLAHVARPIVLADSLDATRYEAMVACNARYARFVDGHAWRSLPLESIGGERFMRALASGSPVYDAATLRDYVRADLRLIEAHRPDLVIGDFRLSLSVSCRLAGVPYAAVTNAYWSPYVVGLRNPLPVLPFTRVLPLPLARAIFNAAQPLAFALHCRPLNQVRREHGLSSLGSDLRRVYTDADHTLYADVPGLFDLTALPSNHHLLGPILWSPEASRPTWWDDPGATGRPVVYVTLGSSGHTDVLIKVLDGLARLPVTVIASTAGQAVPQRTGGQLYLSDYLPGTEAATRSALVICNGGSPTSQQALAAGVPVLGVAGNMDQFLNMAAIEAAGAGLTLRADRLSDRRLQQAVERILQVPDFRSASRMLASRIAQGDATRRFTAWVDALFDMPTTATGTAQGLHSAI